MRKNREEAEKMKDIIVVNPPRLMTFKEIDYEFDGMDVLVNNEDFFPEDRGYVLAYISSDIKGCYGFMSEWSYQTYSGKCYRIHGAFRGRWEKKYDNTAHVSEVS